MTIQTVIAFAGAAVLALASPAYAQAERESASPGVEITPYVSLGSNAASGLGAAVRWPLASRISFEVETGFRDAEINGVNASVGLLYDLPRIGRVTPYVAGGIGLEQHGWVTQVSGYGPMLHSGTAFTVNAGGGARVPVDENWGFRSDARWSNGVGANAPERWRIYNGVTFGRSAH